MDQFQSSKILLAQGLIDHHADSVGDVEAAHMFIIHGDAQGLFLMLAHKVLWQTCVFPAKDKIMNLPIIVALF